MDLEKARAELAEARRELARSKRPNAPAGPRKASRPRK
jgi:hypothetical protein